MNLITGICDACTASCLTCVDYNKCVTCKNGQLPSANNECLCEVMTGGSGGPLEAYRMSEDGYCKPSSSNPNCIFARASNENECLLCKSGELQNFICTCPAGYTYNSEGICTPCHPTCGTCSGLAANQCTSCKPDVTLNGNTFTCACATGQFLNSQGFCESCFSTCVSCWGDRINQCTVCRAGLTLANGICSCPTGTYLSDDFSCKIQCHPSCKSCTGPSQDQCSECFDISAVLTSSNTCECPSSLFMNLQGNCEACHASCATCSSAGDKGCTKCWSNAGLAFDGSCRCTVGFQSSVGEGVGCTAIPESSTCSLSISYYVFQSPIAQCTACMTNMILSSAGQCVCKSGYSDMIGQSCMPCNGPCTKCNKPDISSPIQCLQCRQYSNIQLSLNCLCLPGFELTPDTLQCVPIKCHSSCETCSGSAPNQCLTCKYPAYKTSDNRCVCPPGQFLDSSGTCRFCHPTCLTCTGLLATNCLTCRPGAILQGGVCECSQTAYFDPVTLSCQSCHPTCKSCSDAANTACTSCQLGATLGSDGACICPTSMTMDANTGQCVQPGCHPTCFTCSSPASSAACLSCRTGVILSTSRTCICPSGLTMDTTTGQCKSVSCHPTCAHLLHSQHRCLHRLQSRSLSRLWPVRVSHWTLLRPLHLVLSLL
jgi:hypothetical protein